MSVTVHGRPADTLLADEVGRWREVPTAILVDVSAASCQIDPAIRPLCPPGHQPRLFGRAVTARVGPPDFGAVLYALDLLQPGDVLVIAAGGHTATAMIGEILGDQLRRRGGRGIVCDGAVRDVARLAAWPDLSVFARAITPRGPTSMEWGAVNIPVIIGGRLITPGDLLIGDDDGLASLDPPSARAFIGAAEVKLELEASWIASLTGGRSAAETFGLPTPLPPLT
jgi:4-hydroxy-4-methyl-2-oxoglutarate aldolase